MIEYLTDAGGVRERELAGFFAGWSTPPAERAAVLRAATHVVLARDGGLLVGFVTALSDGVLSAYLPLLEVLPGHRGRGIGRELVRRVLAELGPLYGVDVCCDDDVVPFYRRLGFHQVNGMVLR